MKQAQEDRRQARLQERTRALIKQQVAVRTADQIKPLVGTVQDVIAQGDDRYPKSAIRKHGNYLLVRTSIGEIVASRHRVKPLPDKR